MRRIQYHRYGGPEEMRLEEAAEPVAGKGQIVARVVSASINPVDWRVRSGAIKFMTGKNFPKGMGLDFAGVVEAVGEGVSGLKPGDEVFGSAIMKVMGTFADKVVTDAGMVAIKPANLSFDQAAALPTVSMAALQAIAEQGKAGQGTRIFIGGCTGGVGQAAVQIAKSLGATVTGSCRASARGQAEALGVDEVIDYASLDPAALGRKFDIVFDTSGKMPLSDALGLVRKGGRLFDINPAPAKFLSLLLGRPIRFVFGAATRDRLERIGTLASQGRLQIAVGEAVPLEQAVALITRLEQGGNAGGKAIVKVA